MALNIIKTGIYHNWYDSVLCTNILTVSEIRSGSFKQYCHMPHAMPCHRIHTIHNGYFVLKSTLVLFFNYSPQKGSPRMNLTKNTWKMRSLKGYILKQLVNCGSSDGSEKYIENPVNGNSMKIGSSFVCHIVLKELRDVHFVIQFNEHNQVRCFLRLNEPIIV